MGNSVARNRVKRQVRESFRQVAAAAARHRPGGWCPQRARGPRIMRACSESLDGLWKEIRKTMRRILIGLIKRVSDYH